MKRLVEKTKKINLLTLDCDGVVNKIEHSHNDKEIDPTCMYFLNKIMENAPNTYIILTTSWGNRNNQTIHKLTDNGFKYPERIIGTAGRGFCGESKTKYRRSEYIYKFIEIMGIEYENIAFLDDEPSMYSPSDMIHLVRCNSLTGLSLNEANYAILKLLGIELKFWSGVY